ncbi:class I SAM-dependent methyltransferase [Dokdonia donghaensis]|uniref:Methyltransferase n=1 Tax=Dokdonia donghaensis DSW-1 TaxID=1300343 RepID=A0A0A2H471_9FLAO|nr:methyltransferase [Dokdonia donghaensis]ANH60123.1 hypothetical protein I597_1205 [Dokdonia donghaensis DSW-1]KGO07420.1 methyltransferase [Dokdonia donghaensis DSW-1]
MYENTFPNKRYKHTLHFLKDVVSTDQSILDLGVRNPFVTYMEREGYNVQNTTGEDLDLDTTAVKNADAEVVTAFEIFEHLLSPFTVLQDIKANKIVASVPLKLWFTPAYRSKTDMWDRHYHEFEDWQFDWLFEKAGWEIQKREKFTNPVKKLGFRPLLRLFTPRYYLIYATRK